MGIIRHNELPPDFQKGRHYKFYKRADGVACEDMCIASTLLCHGFHYANKKVVKEYSPGSFGGTLLGRVTATGEEIYLFIIQGNPGEFVERQMLFHMGAYRVDPADYKAARMKLMGAINVAKQAAKRINFPVNGLKEGGNDGKILNKEGVCTGGGDVHAGGDRELEPPAECDCKEPGSGTDRGDE